MSYSGLLSINEVNELDLDQFLWLFGNVIEKNSEATKYVFNKKPFKTSLHVNQLFNEYLNTLSEQEQEKILQQHPDLGANLKMTEESTREQESVGINNLNEEEQETLLEYNYRYREKFRFPFVICVRDNTTDSILEIIKRRLENEKEIELRTGIEEVKKIIKYRIRDLVWHN